MAWARERVAEVASVRVEAVKLDMRVEYSLMKAHLESPISKLAGFALLRGRPSPHSRDKPGSPKAMALWHQP